MFCANCGKELRENAKFCPECGAPTDIAAENVDGGNEEKGTASEPKICGIGDYELLRQMTEKAGKTKKITGMITTVLLLVYTFLMARGLLRNLISVLEGREELMEFVLSIFAIILVTCGLLHLGLEIILPILQGRKAVRAEEYLKYILVNDRRALMHALAQMQCSSVKSAYMDEHSDVCVAGKKSKHTFTIQNGMPAMTSKKDNYKAVLERETIAGCLLKFLVPEAPVNAYENEKSNARLSRMRMMVAAAAAVCGVILIAVAIVFGAGNRYINMVKNGYPEIYPNITYEQAFDAFFSDCDWKYFESEAGQDVVEFNGNCFYGDDKVTVTIQFLVHEDKGTFEIYTAAIDHEVQPEWVYSLLLLNVFESYGENSGKGKLQLEDLESNSLRSTSQEDTYIVGEQAFDTEDFNDSNDWRAKLYDTVPWESIYMLSGRWSDGTIELSISIYSDVDEYSAYEEVGTCFYGEILGMLYLLGSDGDNQYLMCELDQGDGFVLQYWGDEYIKIVETSEGVHSAEGVILYCQEHYIS